MRILHVIDTLRLGGSPTFLKRLSGALAQRGHEQTVVCLNQLDPELVEGFDPNVRLVRFGAWQYITGVALARLVHMSKGFDVLHTVLGCADAVGRCAGRISGTPVVSSIRGQKPLVQMALDRFTPQWISLCTVNASTLIEHSVRFEGIRREIIRIIFNGIDPSPYLALDRAAGRTLLGFPEDAYVFGCVARLHPQKGHDLLLQAMAKVVEEYPHVRLAMVGEGSLRGALERQRDELGLQEHARFLGSRADVPLLLGGMDAFVLSSAWEGMPNCVLEAMAAGLPVAATAVDAMPELVEHEVTGYLVPPKSVDGIAKSMLRLAADPEEGRTMGQAGRALLLERFSLDSMVSGFEKVFQNAAKLRSPLSSSAATARANPFGQ